LLQTGKELTTTNERCSLKGDVTLNVDGSTLQNDQTGAVAFIARDQDFQPLYCGMAWPIQQDSNLVEAIGVCISIQTALKEEPVTKHRITVCTDNKYFVDQILKEQKSSPTNAKKKTTEKPIAKLVTWVVKKLDEHKNLEVIYVPRIRNIAADELSHLARSLTPVVVAKNVIPKYKPLWDDQKKIDDDMGKWIHTYVYWRHKILDVLKGTLLEDMLLVRVGIKEGKQLKTVEVMIATVNEAQLREDVHQTRDLVKGITFYL
jgi:ribonuclease HI